MSRIKNDRPKNYFKNYIIFLKVFGLSLTGNESIAYKVYSFVILSTAVYAYTILGTYELFKHDWKTSSGFIMYPAAGLAAVIKVTTVLVTRIKFGEVLAKVEQAPFLPNVNRGGDEEERLIRECIWKMNVQGYVYWCLSGTHMLTSYVRSFRTRLRSNDYHDWRLPYGPLTFINTTYSPNFEIAYIYEIIGTLTFVAHYLTIDLLIAAVLAHSSLQFKLLQNFFRHLVAYSYKEMLKDTPNNSQSSSVEVVEFNGDIDSSTIPWKYLQKSIKEAVRYHLAIIDIVKEMEELFRYLLLSTFLVSLSILCFETYRASSQDSTLGLMLNVSEYMNIIITVIVVCYWGEQVMAESQKVGSAAYESAFLRSDLRFQKALILVSIRSQRPIKLTAGKFTDICLATLLWVMRASYSAFMVLRNTNVNKM